MQSDLQGRRIACHGFAKRSACPTILNAFVRKTSNLRHEQVNQQYHLCSLISPASQLSP
jgi:hypothetical protein